jgi:amino acid transporter
MGLTYSELTTSVKIKGGEFAYTYRFLGRIPAFFCGWFLIFGYLTILPWVAVSVSSLFSYFIPFLSTFELYTVLGNTLYLPQLIIGLVMIWGITLLNMRGVRSSKAFQTTATVIMFITFFIFFIGCLIFGDVSNITPKFAAGGTGKGILLAIASMLFFMNGFDTIPKTVDEASSKINYKNMARALVGTIVVGTVFYLAVIFFSSLILSPEVQVNLGSLPLIEAFQRTTGSLLLTIIMAFGVLMCVMTTFNGFLLAGGKLLASFAESGFIGAGLAKTNDKNVPQRAIIMLACIATAGIFLGKGLLVSLIILGGIAFLIAWFFVAFSAYRFNIREADAIRPFKIPGGKPMMLLAMIISGGLTLMMIIPGTPISLGFTEYILLLVWAGVGAILFVAYRMQAINLTEIK